MPYSASDVASVIPPSASIHTLVWCINTPMLNFLIVVCYNGDQVLRQIGCCQHIPDVPMHLGDDIHKIDKKGKNTKNWTLGIKKYITVWNTWLERRPRLESCLLDFILSMDYQQCFAPKYSGYSGERPRFAYISHIARSHLPAQVTYSAEMPKCMDQMSKTSGGMLFSPDVVGCLGRNKAASVT
ncbi:hypothetical protein PVK06_012228 [Gossypium arboreum]|uniref:Uncharacterized protein n=1 Tax=Gossypium arboreum TaxID=29729 RepID=A0ABR0QAT5_GOSAR|nr:hypothetical protein PVK06_012228 [Gossypium arboreum]